MENAYYSVISPEGCAAILWKENSKAPDAAHALKLTGRELLEMKLIDGVIPEPLGGAHRDFEQTAKNVESTVSRALEELKKLSKKELLEKRYEKYRRIGAFKEKK